jgi:hypothetical protein
MQSSGNHENGFSVVYDARAKLVRVGVWGFWEQALAEAFPAAVLDACRGGSCAAVLIDALQFKPQREFGQGAFQALIAAMNGMGPSWVAVVYSNILTKMQMVRITKGSKIPWSFHSSEREATLWLTNYSNQGAPDDSR